MKVDEALKKYATPTQLRYLEALEQYGSLRKAAVELKCDRRGLQRSLAALRDKAALSGYSPEHDMTHEVPGPYMVKGTSTLYDKEGNKALQWVKTTINQQAQQEALREWIETLADEARGIAKPVKAPAVSDTDLMTQYVMADLHLGLYAWAQEAGEDFDLAKAEASLLGSMARLVEGAPKAQKGVILGLGDMLHADDSRNVTPASGHALDVDTRYGKVIQVALRCLTRSISMALEKHREVEVYCIGGNHDPHSSYMVAHCLKMYYEREPRVTVYPSESVFTYFRFGKSLIGLHHGHTVKMDDLGEIMATDRPQDWAESLYRYWYTGHIHHKRTLELRGCTVESFRTLAAKDAWHASKGYRSGRNMEAITLHREYGEIQRQIVDIRMIKVAA